MRGEHIGIGSKARHILQTHLQTVVEYVHLAVGHKVAARDERVG